MSILTCFLNLILIPYAASLTFNLSKSSGQQDYREIVAVAGSAYISDDGIQVTPEDDRQVENKKSGRATCINPLHLWDNASTEVASFSTTFSFVIDSKLEPPLNYGDGLTFFLAENNSVISNGEAMGLPINLTTRNQLAPFVAVEFDTYWNEWLDPNDTYTFHDNKGDHVGININNLSSVSYKKWLSNITNGRECQAWIDYNSFSKILSVSFTAFLDNEPFQEVGLNYTIDLRNVLPEWVIFGFSAATGTVFQKNNVRSWAFSSSTLIVDEKKAIPPTTAAIPPITSVTNSTLADQVKSKKGTGYMVGLIAGACVLVALLAVVAFFCWRKSKKKGDDDQVKMNNEFEKETGPRRFSYQELARSTGGFSGKEKLGEGGFGEVYKGFLEDSRMYVAVKRVSKNSNQGIKEFASEVKIISRSRHRNLVQLIGWCHEKGELLLVYELMVNGSLDLHLFKGKSLLAWGTRYQIANGLASALLYLHEDCEPCVVHRDVKSSNVMLDSSFNAKLGDFGLAKLVDHEKASQTTMMAGTMGYMAPEYVATGKASKESDVFSFGVVALELACARQPIVEKQARLVDWVWGLYGTRTLLEAADPRLDSHYVEDEIICLMTVGLWCAHPDPCLRPSMRQAIQVLKYEASLPLLPSKMPVASYVSSPTSSSSYGVPSTIQIQSSSSGSNYTGS